MSFDDFFAAAVGWVGARPYAYQRALAEQSVWPVTLEVPTGLGKTEAVVLAWLFRRSLPQNSEPRRLVYVLPMRSLVEQTRDRVATLLTNLKIAGFTDLPDIEILIGGETGNEWIAEPSSPRILIGTQDMILSRALNRGYGMSRFQWPMAFAWLNNDALWVVDEVQLQGVGATTAAQLQGLRDAARFGSFGHTSTIFVSATVSPALLESPDHSLVGRSRTSLTSEDLSDPRVLKIVSAVKIAHRLDAYEDAALSAEVHERHRAGTRTLVIVNTVDRAVKIYSRLRKRDPAYRLVLLHSRFRPEDRAGHLAEALAEPRDAGVVVVATQVVEAGIDFSAATLFSDLAPGASIVQRLGRCNRKGEDDQANFYWIEPGELKAATARPYRLADLEIARTMLLALEGGDVGPAHLPAIEISDEPSATLRRVDLLELFDTASDLSGNDIDVSRFIREGDEFNVQVLWRDEPPDAKHPPRREELCAAPKGEVEKIIKRLKVANHANSARTNIVTVVQTSTAERKIASWLTAPSELRIGEIVWLARHVGGYRPDLGFDASALQRVELAAINDRRKLSVDTEDETVGDDRRAIIGVAITISMHADDAAQEARQLCAALDSVLDEQTAEIVERAARWHDAGKVHPVFQETMRRAAVPNSGGPWAKGVKTNGIRHDRRFFRHEVGSALAWLASHEGKPDADLIAYLVLAHHGKVRVSVYSQPGEPVGGARSIFGNCQGDKLVAVDLGDGEHTAEFMVDLSLFDVGSVDDKRAWTQRVATLCDDERLGPFRLGFLESLVRVADWRASSRRQRAEDPTEAAV